MSTTSDAAAFGEGLLRGLEPYIQQKYEQSLIRDKAKGYAETLVEMSDLDLEDEEKDYLIMQMSKTVSPNTLQSVLNQTAALGSGTLQINRGSDKGGNQLGETNIYWKIPSLNPNQTERERNRIDWYDFRRETQTLVNEGFTPEAASVEVLSKLMKTNPSKISNMSKYVYGSEIQVHKQKEDAAIRANLLTKREDNYGNRLIEISTEADKLMGAVFPNMDFTNLSDTQKYNLIVNHRKSPAFAGFALSLSSGMAGMVEAADAFQSSADEANKERQIFSSALGTIIGEPEDEVFAETSADIPTVVKDRMSKSPYTTKAGLTRLLALEDAGRPSDIIYAIATQLTAGVEESRREEIRKIVENYLNSLLEDS